MGFDRSGRGGVVDLRATKGGGRRALQEIVALDDSALLAWLRRLASSCLPGDFLVNVGQAKFGRLFGDLCAGLAVDAVA